MSDAAFPELPPLPDGVWPPVPRPGGDTTPDEILELYKAELSATNERITKYLEAQAAAQEHTFKISEIEKQAEVDVSKAAELARVEKAAAEETAKVERSAAEALALVNADVADLADSYQQDIAEQAFVTANITEFHKAYVEIAKGSLDRMTQRAQLIQAAAVAIAALYTGLLAYVYTQADSLLNATVTADTAVNHADVAGKAVREVSQFPMRGIIPTIFLGAAIAFAMAHLAFRGLPHKGKQMKGAPNPYSYLDLQRNAFVEWANQIEWYRVMFIQLAVISLGLGVAALPLAFINIDDVRARNLTLEVVAGVGVVFFCGWIVTALRRTIRLDGSFPWVHWKRLA